MFEITTNISTDEWSKVDKDKVFQVLKGGLEKGLGGIKEAIAEVYAVVKAEVNEQLTQDDAWGLHHQIKDNGNVVLNRAGVMEAVAALAKDELSDSQREDGRQHLRRHYEEMELELPDSLLEPTDKPNSPLELEMVGLEARLVGEMSPQDIPLAEGVDLSLVKGDDTEPMEVVVEVPAGKSKRGWDYTEKSLQDIVDYVNKHTLNGFLGHQEPEKVNREFLNPATHWVGALWQNGKAYFRGVLDKGAVDLKRWIKGKRVNQVSIFGYPRLKQEGGETSVVGYRPLSIDWTPLHRAGMQTRIVAVGEMDSILEDGGNKKMTIQEMLAAIRSALAKKETDLKTVLGEMGITDKQALDVFGGDELKSTERLADFGKKLVAVLGLPSDIKAEDGVKLAGEMAEVWKTFSQHDEPKKLACEMASVWNALGLSGCNEPDKVAAEMSAVWQALGFETEKPEDPAKVVGEMIKLQSETIKEAKKRLVDKCVKEKVSGEQAQELVKRILSVPDTAGKEEIAGEIDTLLKDEAVKGVLDKLFIDKPAGTGGSSQLEGYKSVKIKKSAI